MRIPDLFTQILDKDPAQALLVAETINLYQPILEENKLYFFEEYTDHGIRHINSVLEFSAILIRDSSYAVLERSPKSIAWYILAVILHDLGMHLTPEGFCLLVKGTMNPMRIQDLDKKTWPVLWDEFLVRARRFNDKEKENIIGNRDWQFRIPPIEHKDKLTGEDKKLIGEFIRLHHPRIAHEIALHGFPAPGSNLPFASDMRPAEKYLVGLLARSHGVDIRPMIDLVRNKYPDTWTKPFGSHLFYLMAVLRIADYCQIDASRLNPVTLKLKTFRSPVSQLEHYTHEDLPYLQTSCIDPETLAFHCEPRNSFLFVKIKNLLSGLQQELDRSWAVLGEVYGKEPPQQQLQLRYRRIKANIDDTERFAREVNYIPERVQFTVAHELSGSLIRPLYGNSPTYGIRELIQNAVDACRHRAVLEKNGYQGTIRITFYKKGTQAYFRIEDDGIGMSLDVLKNYYLRAGASYRTSAQFREDCTDKEGNCIVLRNGKFGIGVLGAFLLGDTINVHTKAVGTEDGLQFETTQENEHIEIVKAERKEAGTTIEIPVNATIINQLKDGKNRIRFDRWFVHASPKLVYDDQLRVFGPLGPVSHMPGYDDAPWKGWYDLPNSGYAKVQWNYSGRMPQFCEQTIGLSNEKHCLNLWVNGITVSDNTGSMHHALSLQVFDSEGKFPVNLSRNGIDGPIPFEDQLMDDMLKRCFASIVSCALPAPHTCVSTEFPVDRYITDPLLGRIPLLSSPTGFIVATNYFHVKNNKRSVLASRSNHCLHQLPASFMDGGFIDIVPEDTFSDWAAYNVLKRYKALIRVNAHSHESLKKMTRYTSGVLVKEMDHNQILVESDYEGNMFDMQEILDTIGLEAPREKELYIIESKLDDYPLTASMFATTQKMLKEFHLFDAIVQRYMNGHTEIPYEMEERKQLFPEAFEELRRFMG